MPININSNELNTAGGNILVNKDIPTFTLFFDWDAGLPDSYPGTGTKVNNFVGSISGSLQNGVTYSTDGGGSWVFDGVDDRILLENYNYSISLGNGNTNWTVHAWVKTSAFRSGLTANPVLSNTNGGPIYGSLDVDDGLQTYWVYPSNTGGWTKFQGGIPVDDGIWHLLTWANKSNYTMDLYFDGFYDTNVGPTNAGNNNPMDVIGGGLGTSFLGSIGMVAVYPINHTLSEVTEFYNSTRTRFGR